MLTCQNCGAQIEPNSPKCPFCEALTAGGIWQQHDDQRRQREHEQASQAQAHYQATQEHHARLHKEQALKSSAKGALVWSIVGAVLCCIPIPAVVALVMSLRVRAEARRMGAPWPTNAMAALGISVLSMLAFAGLIVQDMLQDQEREARVSKLESQVAAGAKKTKLSLKTACKLVEIELLQNNFDGHPNSSLESVKCPGEVKRKGKTAKLDDVRAKYSSENKVRLVACFKRGSRWAVDELGRESCGDDADASSAKPAGSAGKP